MKAIRGNIKHPRGLPSIDITVSERCGALVQAACHKVLQIKYVRHAVKPP